MLNRKESNSADRAGHRAQPVERPASAKAHRQHRRFVISHKAGGHNKLGAPEPANGASNAHTASQAKAAYASSHGAPAAGKSSPAVDLTETIKTLLHLAHEHGHVTYDDINDILPDGLSPEDLDELYTKLRNLEVEICKRIEEAESDIKRLVYDLGFAAKEHIAIAEKLLSEPPKERFDRVVV